MNWMFENHFGAGAPPITTTIEATRLLWAAAGSPAPCDTKGEPIGKCRGDGHCARCGAPDGCHSLAQLVSQNFLPTRNRNRLMAHGGTRFCPACLFAAKALRLRCISWFASTDGVGFFRTRPVEKGALRPDALMELLSPPKPPFVAGVPLYGIAHGGEAHWMRTWWPGETLSADPLIKLQSKHVALYARTAYSSDRYPVQVDDDKEVTVDRDTWLYARDDATSLMRSACDDGRKPWQSHKALQRLQLPPGSSSALARAWSSLTRPLQEHTSATWWPVFCSLIPPLEDLE